MQKQALNFPPLPALFSASAPCQLHALAQALAMALSDRQIKALKPQAERYSVWDGQGLGLRVGVGGRKTWIFVYQYRTRRRMMQLGVYPAMTLAQARQAHAQAKILLTQGTDLIEAAQAAKAAAKERLTVRRLGERYIALYARQRRSN